MPGILPMKVIRVGSAAQSRIAQACDRCRSKKIRCDGIRPCCTQCANVGFECKTSDKLSRRAFPRGYTESLEDRVRVLESEVKELKDLLDEKDEKIDVLSRIHAFSPRSRKCSSSLSPPSVGAAHAVVEESIEDVIHVECPAPASQMALLPGTLSTTAAFIDLFNRKTRDSGRNYPEIHASTFVQPNQPVPPAKSSNTASKIPPRLLSDQYINIFFQEWAPLFPILHRQTFLRIYDEYLADPEAGHWHSNKQAVAQLFLIFDISALSSVSRIQQSTVSCESQWRKALYCTSCTPTIPTLQCHVLAQLLYLLKADYIRLARHRALAVTMCHQLGLHQNQRYSTLSPLEAETRKKVFWTQYVLDKFASAASGTPMLFHEADISTEYPADIDDENISAQGISPALPGELTKISSALALFRASRILSRVLEELYPASASYQLPVTKLHALSDELDQWHQNLPPHLRLQFIKDKPSTAIIGCRSPLLSLAYFFTKSLIHRPLVSFGSGNGASTSTLALTSCAKHIVQVLDLLEERRMSYTFPTNKPELLLSSGFALLWQCAELPNESRLLKDNQKSLILLTDIITRDNAGVGFEFQSIASSFISFRCDSATAQSPSSSLDHLNGQGSPPQTPDPVPETKYQSTKKQLQAIASRLSSFGNKVKGDETPRRSTVPAITPSSSTSPYGRHSSAISISSTQSAPVLPHYTVSGSQSTDELSPKVNLDFFEPFGGCSTSAVMAHLPRKEHMNENVWQQILTTIDSGHANIYDGIYNGTSPDLNFLQCSDQDIDVNEGQDWVQMPWPMSALDLSMKTAVPQSVLSFSEESLTSGEDLTFSGSGSNSVSALDCDNFGGITIPACDDGDLNEFDRAF